MAKTTDFEKTQKSKQYLKIRMSETTTLKKHKNPINTWKSQCLKLMILKKTQKSKQYLKITMSETADFEKNTKIQKY